MRDDLILSDPAVAAKSVSLSRASLLFPIMSFIVNIHGKNNFIQILGEGFTILRMSSTPNIHFTLTAAPFHRSVPLCSSLQCPSWTCLALSDAFFLLVALILQVSKEEGNQFRNKYFWFTASVCLYIVDCRKPRVFRKQKVCKIPQVSGWGAAERKKE